MEYLKFTEKNGSTVYVNADKIISLTPRACGDVTILAGAGLYWHARPDSIEQITLDVALGEVRGS